MISLQNIVLQRGITRLLEPSSVTIHPGRSVGVIGANGCGKSSLFKLLLGELSLDAGELNIPKQWRLSHMAQEVLGSDRSALDFVIDGDRYLRQLQAAIADAEANEQHAQLTKLYADLDAHDGYQAKTRAEQLLHGLGFQQHQINHSVNEFSGGWRIRLNLAQALMCPSDLLLLDEPTNHLDLDATLWLEQWLKAYKGTLVIISHDRDFLDNLVDEVLSFENNRLHLYRGNYSAFERQRAERLAQQQVDYEKQQQRIAEINRFVTRFKAKATKAKQAQSRVKELARMELIAPAHVDSPFYFSFRESEKISDPLLNLVEADIGYADKTILQNVSLNLHPGSRIGLLGVNGAGKSTLIKAITAELTLQAGTRTMGEHLALGYFAQHQLEALDLDASALLHIQRLSPEIDEQTIRNFLGGFNFHGDKALESIKPFSGGEKARLALAIIVWQRPNLLLLDEPTNHLDLEMRHALTMALQGYVGALLVISHDRHLLRNTVDEFYLVDQAKLAPYAGTLDDYAVWLKQRGQQVSSIAEALQDVSSQSDTQQKQDKKNQRQQAAQRRQQLKPINDKIRQIEKILNDAQSALQAIETQLADSTLYEESNKQRLTPLLQEQGTLQKQVADAEAEWLGLQEELEAAEAAIMIES